MQQKESMLLKTYVSAGMHVAYYMAVGSHAYSEDTYMPARTYIAQEYYMAVGSHICSAVTYMPART